MEPTVNKYKNDDPPPPPPSYAPTPSPILQCTAKEQTKCCNYQGTLKEAAKYCKSLECDIADCNKQNNGGYSNNNNNNKNDGGYFNIDVRNDGYVTYGDGGRPQGNKGPKEDGSGSTADYGSNGGGGDRPIGNKGPREDGSGSTADSGNYGGGGDRPQGNKGPREDGSGSTADSGSNGGGGDNRPMGNKGPRDGSDSTADDNNESGDRPQGNKGSKDKGDNFLNQGVNENCTREYTAGGACREVCTAKVEYKLMGIVMSTHDETTTRPCS